MHLFALLLLIANVLDCTLSTVATLVPAIETASNAISMVVMPCNLIALALVCAGRLRPLWIFLPLSVLYLLMMAFGILLAILYLIERGPEADDFTIQTLFTTFPWYGSVHWTLLGLWAVSSTAALVAYLLWKRTGPMPPPLPR